MRFVDTHCHIQEAQSKAPEDDMVQSKWAQAGINSPSKMLEEAEVAGVDRLLAVGCTLRDSQLAVDLAGKDRRVWASIGIHPHEAKDHLSPRVHDQFAQLAKKPRVVAIGECGLDYYYSHSSKADQLKLLEFQLQVATEEKLPVIFHVRDAFDEFWPVFDRFSGLQGVIHSFTANVAVLEQILSRGLYVGLNGIVTFAKQSGQAEAVKAVPLEKMLLETDAPFLTPHPFRGTICQPKHVVRTAEFLSEMRGESLESIASATTHNAITLFKL